MSRTTISNPTTIERRARPPRLQREPSTDVKRRDTLQEAVGCQWVSSLVLTKSRQNQKPSDPLLLHNQNPHHHRYHKTELLSEPRPDGGEHAGRENEPV